MNADTWNRSIQGLPGAHILQTWQWGHFKQAYGWQPDYWISEDGLSAALVMQRGTGLPLLPVRLKVRYVPRGPLLDWDDPSLRRETLDMLQLHARKAGAVFVKIDPQVVIGCGIPGTPEAVEEPLGQDVQRDLLDRGWLFSAEQVQFRNTVLIDLQCSEEELLARMKQKTRYNIRLAQRKGVAVRPAQPQDFEALYQIYAETSVRDGFVIRPRDYYLRLWREFFNAGMLLPLLAEVNQQPVAGLMLFHFAGSAWYLHGMSAQAHREKMPNALLQWEAMRAARAQGCRQYDLWGAPDRFDESDSMWGVYRFKEGLGGQVVRGLGAWDFPVRRQLYILYTRLLPRVLDVLRRRGQAQTRQEVGA